MHWDLGRATSSSGWDSSSRRVQGREIMIPQFPTRPCRVSLYMPPDVEELVAYEVTLWQEASEAKPT
jgi:hypothetical protein